MKNFVLLGTAGYVAPRHLKAIKETGNNLIASYDISDSVGIIDRYFPASEFFTEKNKFLQYLKEFKNSGNNIDYFSICTPNHLHEDQIKMALNFGADVICEKPIVINPKSLSSIKEMQDQTGKKVFTILQLRLLEQLVFLKKSITQSQDRIHHVDLKYITPRGNWYLKSWKGDASKSGGIITNIGIHLFDLLIWLFGSPQHYEISEYSDYKAKGILQLEHAKVNWFLSIDRKDLKGLTDTGQSYRSIKIDHDELEFSKGFENLHTLSYQKIIEGEGFDIDQATQSIDLVYALRSTFVNKNS